MGSTFTRINSVTVDPTLTKIHDAYVDPTVAVGGTYAAQLAQPLNTLAGLGVLYRGMPVFLSLLTGKIVPPNASIGTSSTTGSTTTFAGILIDDLTQYIAARGTKLAFATGGRVRSYAAGTITPGARVKVDISSTFGGVLAWASATDDANLIIGRAYPLDDGSATGTPVTTINQGDTIFLDL